VLTISKTRRVITLHHTYYYYYTHAPSRLWLQRWPLPRINALSTGDDKKEQHRPYTLSFFAQLQYDQTTNRMTVIDTVRVGSLTDLIIEHTHRAD